MDKKEFYNEKVLTSEECEVLSATYLMCDAEVEEINGLLRKTISDVMEKLYVRYCSTELVTENYTIINRFGQITVQLSGEEECDIDDISIENLMVIVSEIVNK